MSPSGAVRYPEWCWRKGNRLCWPRAVVRARCQSRILRGCGTGQARCQIRVIRHLRPAGHDVRFVSFVAAYRAGTMSDLCHSPPGTDRARCQICVLRGCGTEADSVAFGTVGPRAAVRARWQIRVIRHPGPAGERCQIRVLHGRPTEADSVTFGSMR